MTNSHSLFIEVVDFKCVPSGGSAAKTKVQTVANNNRTFSRNCIFDPFDESIHISVDSVATNRDNISCWVSVVNRLVWLKEPKFFDVKTIVLGLDKRC